MMLMRCISKAQITSHSPDRGDKEAWQIRVERERHYSPSLTGTPFITGHMTPSTVQAGMVYLASFVDF